MLTLFTNIVHHAGTELFYHTMTASENVPIAVFKNQPTTKSKMNLPSNQSAAIKCAFIDLHHVLKAHDNNDLHSIDFDAVRESYADLLREFPFLEDLVEQLNMDGEEEEEEDTAPFKLVPCLGGSCRQGTIKTTYQNLVDCFGEPNHEGDGGYKVSFEWAILFADGTYATIYDWKWSDSERMKARSGVGGLQTFNVGGFKIDAVWRVQDALGPDKYFKSSLND